MGGERNWVAGWDLIWHPPHFPPPSRSRFGNLSTVPLRLETRSLLHITRSRS